MLESHVYAHKEPRPHVRWSIGSGISLLLLVLLALGILTGISAIRFPVESKSANTANYSHVRASFYSPVGSPCPSWGVISGANISGGETVLNSVSAAATNDIWAVGFSMTGGVAATLTEHWDGKTWTIVPSPNPQPGSNYLDGVVALSSNNAWAVGDSGTSQNPGTVLLHWDGTGWTQAHLPALEPSGNSLYSISALSPNDIWAAGVRGNFNSHSGGLIMHYNGVDWSVVPSPSRGTASILYGISTRASNDVWTVGAAAQDPSVQTLVQHWDGSSWSNVFKRADSASRENALWSVAALAPNNVWAVGSHCPRAFDCHGHVTIIEHWDGNTWGSYNGPSPNGGTNDNNYAGLVALSASDIWAVGYGTTGKEKRPLISHWDGREWLGIQVVANAIISQTSALNGVTKIPSGDVIAVGTIGDEGARRSLIEVYTDRCAAPPTATSIPANTPVPVIQTPTSVPTLPAVPLPGEGSRTFPETGQTVNGIFLDYWNNNGGLAQQGFPISQPFGEVSDLNGQPYTVQYFERAVFEYHPENQPPFNVLLSQLGTFRYKQKYPNGAPGQQPNTSAGSVLFPETGKRLGGKFLTYWQSHGGLAQQGFPISDEFTEVSDLNGKPYTVQYFERAVFESHPENQPPYDILLSQLGTFQYKAKYGK